MTEDEILSRPSYAGESAPPETIEARAFDLVNQIMHQLRGEYDLMRPIDNLSEQQKVGLHGRLWQIAAATLRGEPLLERPGAQPADDLVAAQAVITTGDKPAAGTLTVSRIDVPLDPEMNGEVFTVQVGGGMVAEDGRG